MLDEFEHDCPCWVGGYIHKTKPHLPNKPKKKCPLNLFNNIDHCLSCEFSHAWNGKFNTITQYKNIKLYVYLQIKERTNV